MARNAVIFHHPDGVETERSNLMGRHAAGEGFLNGVIAHGGLDEYFAHTLNADHFSDFARRVRQISGGSESCRRVGPDMIGQHDVPGVLSLPGPELAPFAWRRRRYGNAAYSICGLNHTVASARVMDYLGALLTAPVQPWDALICSSRSAKSAMRHVMEGYADYLEERMNVRPPMEVMMPVIPLGVNCDAFAQGVSATADRVRLRQGLGIANDDVALLYMGRLSFHAKAHPLPMYVAAEAAARRTGRRVHLIQAGWFANEAIEREFREGARTLCPAVNAIFLDGRDQDVRRRIWRAADVFVSLSDNIQEAFGLTPIEAMAAGLPVVVSDWDGYRDTVSDGVHGFTIPTWMPGGGAGAEVAIAPELDLFGPADDLTYDRYCGTVSQATAVDTGACIDALSVLCGDATKRHSMGEAGREHVRTNFDWSVIVSAYQDLWGALEDRRARAGKQDHTKTVTTGIPLRGDPFAMFGAHPTSLISDTTEVRLIDGVDGRTLADRLAMHMNNFSKDQLLDSDDLNRVVNVLLERGIASVHDIAELFDTPLRPKVMISIGWLAKMYLVRLTGGVNTVLDPDGNLSPVGSGPHSALSRGGGEGGMLDGTSFGALDMIDRRDAQGAPMEPAHRNPYLDELLDVPLHELLERTVSARADGNVALAAACLHRASTLMPDDPEVNAQMGELLAAGERYDAAIACFRRAVQAHPDHLNAHRNLGKALFLRGDEAEGIHSFRRAVRVAPDDGEARLLLGTALRRAGAVNEAMQCLRIAMEIDPERADAGYHLGLVYRAMERPDDAREVFRRVLAIDPNHQFTRAALLSMDLVPEADDPYDGRRIGLYMSAPVDFFALRPVFDVLCDGYWPLMSGDLQEITAFRPDALLTTSNRTADIRDHLPLCPLVQVPTAAVRRPADFLQGSAADLVCTVTEPEQQSFLETGLAQHRVRATGLPLTDSLFGGPMRRRRHTGRKPVGRKTILFAPDWQPDVTAFGAMEAVMTRVCAAHDGIYDFVVRPHPLTLENQKGKVEGWCDLAASHANATVHTSPGIDYLTLMAEADVLLADFSPLAFTFLAFDAPMVLIRPSDDLATPYRLSESQISLLEGVSDCVDREQDIAEALFASLDNADNGDEARARIRSVLFGSGADGHAADRVVDALTQFLKG